MQIETGIRSLLSYPRLYNFSQNILGADKHRRIFINEYLNIKSPATICDIGCGTADILEYLPDDISYFGYDKSQKYINYAKTRWGNKAHFFCNDNSIKKEFNNIKFDQCIAMSLLHHIEDYEVIDVLNFAKKHLKENGRFLSIDPCFINNQHFFSRMIINKDRGQNVRTLENLKLLGQSVFDNVNIYHRNDLLRVPYDHAILEVTK
tara:strand:- start:1010 stop:1627 length:618 start_codon:yes stop_codon:yes gene_type:complete